MIKAQLTPLFLPILFFLSLSLSFQSAFSSQQITDGNAQLRRKVLGQLLLAVGRPNLTVGADNAEWTMKSVEFIMDKMNWTINFSGHEHDQEYLDKALQMIVTAFSWLLDEPELNPYRSFTKGLTTFRSLFRYISALDRQAIYGGPYNPVYKCYNAFWPTCLQPSPATLQGAVVYRFDCGFHFYYKCELKKRAEEGTWHIPPIDGAQFGLHA